MNRLQFYWHGQKVVWEDRLFRWKRPVVPSFVVDHSVDDSELTRIAFRVVIDALQASKGFAENKAQFLPRHWRAVYTCFYLDAEVRNGGFHQFFWNSEDSLNDWLVEDVEFAGASAVKDIVCRALRLHRGYDYPDERRQAGLSWDHFAAGYDEKRFEECDDAYFQSDKSLLTSLGAAIKRNAELYVKNA